MACFTHSSLVWRHRSGEPIEFREETYPWKLDGIRGLPYSDNFIILTSTVFVWFTHVTDWLTGDAYSTVCYMLSRGENQYSLCDLACCPGITRCCCSCCRGSVRDDRHRYCVARPIYPIIINCCLRRVDRSETRHRAKHNISKFMPRVQLHAY